MKKSSASATVSTAVRWSAAVAPIVAVVSVLGAGSKWH